MRKTLLWLFVALIVCATMAIGDEDPAATPSEAGGTQVIQNPSFERPGEEGEAPELWEGPVLLDGEIEPSLADLAQRSDFDEEHGDFVAYLRYGSTVPEGWAGLAYEQTDQQFDEVIGPEDLVLVYRILYHYGLGVDHVSDHGGLVEVELRSDAGPHRLRYLHRRDGDLPESNADTVYVDAGDPGFRSWASYEHNLDQDIAQAFPELEGYSIVAVRIGILARRTSPEETRLYWLFDRVQLLTGGTQTSASN